MTKYAIKYALMFVILVVAQAVVFNHMVLFGVAVPLVFLYLIISLPVTVGTNISVALGFLAGLAVDVFCDTPGLNALCCTILAFVRKPMFHLYVSYDDDLAGHTPSSLSMGHFIFMKYLLTMVALYCLMVFGIEAMQVFTLRALVRIVASTAYTFVLLYALDCLSLRSRE